MHWKWNVEVLLTLRPETSCVSVTLVQVGHSKLCRQPTSKQQSRPKILYFAHILVGVYTLYTLRAETIAEEFITELKIANS